MYVVAVWHGFYLFRYFLMCGFCLRLIVFCTVYGSLFSFGKTNLFSQKRKGGVMVRYMHNPFICHYPVHNQSGPKHGGSIVMIWGLRQRIWYKRKFCTRQNSCIDLFFSFLFTTVNRNFLRPQTKTEMLWPVTIKI